MDILFWQIYVCVMGFAALNVAYFEIRKLIIKSKERSGKLKEPQTQLD
jgi:hypothetical protein